MQQKEIARLLGVSPAVVSMVLRGQGRIGAARRAAILDLARRHHVGVRKLHKQVAARPSDDALKLAYCGLQERIGWFHVGTFSGLNETGLGRSYDLSLVLGEIDRGSDAGGAAISLARQVAAGGYHGLISGPHREVVDALARLDLPLVQIGYQGPPDAAHDQVLPDNFTGGFRLAAGLAARGHRRIAVVRCLAEQANSIEKFAGIRAALEQTGVALDPRLVVAGTCHHMEGARCAGLLCAAAGPPPDAIILENDWHAPDLVQQLRRERPAAWPRLKDIAFAMSCDSERPNTLTVSCDRILLPRADMGRHAIRRLLEHLLQPAEWRPQTLRVSPIYLPADA